MEKVNLVPPDLNTPLRERAWIMLANYSYCILILPVSNDVQLRMILTFYPPVLPPSAGVTAMHHHTLFYVVLAMSMLGKHPNCTVSSCPPWLFQNGNRIVY